MNDAMAKVSHMRVVEGVVDDVCRMEHVETFQLKFVRGGEAAFSEGKRLPACSWTALVRGERYGSAVLIEGDVTPRVAMNLMALNALHTLERLA